MCKINSVGKSSQLKYLYEVQMSRRSCNPQGRYAALYGSVSENTLFLQQCIHIFSRLTGNFYECNAHCRSTELKWISFCFSAIETLKTGMVRFCTYIITLGVEYSNISIYGFQFINTPNEKFVSALFRQFCLQTFQVIFNNVSQVLK